MKQFLILVSALFLMTGISLRAQAPSPEEQEKALYESVDKTIERFTDLLDLADWQVFRIDSMLVHDYKAMTEELQALSSSKVSNYDLYTAVQDKWGEQMYNSYRSILNDEQWEKYLKQGAGRAKKARDKRAEKAMAAEAKKK